MAEGYSAETGAGTQPATAAGRYEMLRQDRAPYETRAREASALTIPGLFPPDGTNGATDLPEPYQSVGADCVNNLTAQLLLVLFPPGTSFIRFKMDEFVKEQAEGRSEGSSQEIEAALAKVERSVMDAMNTQGTRVIRAEALLHLIVAGNGLMQVLDDNREKFFPLTRYVVKRDLEGNVLEIITKECLTRDTLPPEARALVQSGPPDGTNKSATVDLYTWVRRDDDGAWTVQQEVEAQIVPGSQGTYPKGKCAFIPLCWTRNSGEDYGRGRCTEKIGDLRTMEYLSKAVVQIALAASKIIFLVSDTAVADVNELARARSGDFKTGRPDDVFVMMLDKMQDFSVAKAVMDEVKQRLERSFLVATSVQRNAERVTAEEIRAMIGQLEQSLGGQYAVLSEEMQRPLAERHMLQLQKRGKLPALPKDTVKLEIITGIEGLGRMTDKSKLDELAASGKEVFDPETNKEYLNPGEYYRRVSTALGVDPKGLVRTDDEVAQSRQAQQNSKLMETATPGLVGLAQKSAEMAGQDQAAPVTA
jgi:hypothetical protein